MSRVVRGGDIFIPGENPPSFVYIAGSAVSSVGAATTDDSQVYVFDSASAQVIGTFKAHSAPINGLSFNDCSKLLMTCCDEGKGKEGNEVSLWDLRNLTGSPICTFAAACYIHYVNRCRSVASSKNGTIIAAGTDAGVITWDVRKPEGVFRHVNLQPDEVGSIQFHPFATATFLAGDDDGNLLMFDLDSNDDEQGNLFYSNDQNPVFQCGFCGVDTVFTLRRTAGMRLWNIMNPERDVVYEDLRKLTNDCFGYPIDAHWCGDWLMTVGGDSEGGVAILLCSESDVKLFEKIEKAHNDCINGSYLDVLQSGEMHLYFAGDGGQLSFWKVASESQ